MWDRLKTTPLNHFRLFGEEKNLLATGLERKIFSIFFRVQSTIIIISLMSIKTKRQTKYVFELHISISVLMWLCILSIINRKNNFLFSTLTSAKTLMFQMTLHKPKWKRAAGGDILLLELLRVRYHEQARPL